MPTSVAPLAETTPLPTPPTPAPVLPLYSWRTALDGGDLRSITYLRDLNRADQLVATLTGPIGFDIEHKPQFRAGGGENPVALLQLADQHRIILLQVSPANGSSWGQSGTKHLMQNLTNLRKLLEDPSIPKLGVGIQDDVTKVSRDCGIHIQGHVDLSIIARKVDTAFWATQPGKLISLARLTAKYTGHALNKSKKVQLANWEMPLTSQMQEYAANDAASALSVYHRLMELAEPNIDNSKPDGRGDAPRPSKFIVTPRPKQARRDKPRQETPISLPKSNVSTSNLRTSNAPTPPPSVRKAKRPRPTSFTVTNPLTPGTFPPMSTLKYPRR